MYRGNTLHLATLDNGMVELCFDNQNHPVNRFDISTAREIAHALEHLESRSDIRGLLVTSSKSGFLSGADSGALESLCYASRASFFEQIEFMRNTLARLEALPLPSVVMIQGEALDGGVDLCLACDCRVMSHAASIGLPQTTLGIIPSFGATLRLPRIIDSAVALQWITTGASQSAESALAAGLVDTLASADMLRDRALALLSECMSDHSLWVAARQQKVVSENGVEGDRSVLFEAAQRSVEDAFSERYPAPKVVAELLKHSVLLGSSDAQKLEAEAGFQLTRTPQVRALVGFRVNEQYLTEVAKSRINGLPGLSGKITHCGVIGAGIMGGGIAYQNVIKGYSVTLKDIQQSALELGLSEASKLLRKGVDRGAISSLESSQTLAKITPTLLSDDMHGCQIIVEAVIENEAIKKSVLAQLEDDVGPETVISSNTSTISIDRLASALKRPENFCGLHFFNPVHAMPLVEIVRGPQSSDRSVAILCEYVLGLGKKPVVVNDCPGFLVNRVLFAMLFGFEMLLAEGADYRRIDTVMENWGWPMGPAYLNDVIGIDTLNHCYASMIEGLPERFDKGELTLPSEALFEANRLGQKNGVGYYQYRVNAKGRPEKQLDEEAAAIVKSVAGSRRDVSDEEIVDRLMLPMAMEMVRCLEEKIVGSPAEADVALIYGIGFPKFRGGICRWMDQIGALQLCDLSDRYARISALYGTTKEFRMRAQRGDRWYS